MRAGGGRKVLGKKILSILGGEWVSISVQKKKNRKLWWEVG